MDDLKYIRSAAKCMREWRDMELNELTKLGCQLSYRPSSGMSSMGWLLAHQGAVYDFSLNFLIRGEGPKHSEMFNNYRPGTSGEWLETPLEEILEFFDTTEREFLQWTENADAQEFDRIIEGERVPKFFLGRSVREIVATMFTHLNYHTGHLAALKNSWMAESRPK
ncbi:MAG: DinB family protein [Candidatus Thorarchaeota archaeon]|nr:MAG: DinB family protein [Candidatus Thorarchaeota archaeon]